MAHPADDTPCVTGTPAKPASTPTGAVPPAHDALTALAHAVPASGDLGQHNGPPASIIVSISLTEMETAAGKATTAGGT